MNWVTARAEVALLAPTLLGIALLLDAYSATAMHWSGLARSFAVVVVGSIALTALAYAVGRRVDIAATQGCLAILLLFGQFEVFLIGLAMTVIAAVVGRWRRGAGKTPIQLPDGVVVVPVLLLLVLMVARLADWGVVTSADFGMGSPPGALVRTAARPNIYVLMLDGYPRQDTLAEMGIDNEPFLNELEREGFLVDRESSSAFHRTDLTLASSSLTNPEELEEFASANDMGELLASYRDVRREHLRRPPAETAFRELGYRLAYVPSGVVHTDWPGWDERLDSGHLTDFEILLIQRSPLRYPLGGWVMEDQRNRIHAAFAAWSDGPDTGKVLVFAHIMSPHPPFLWGREGEELPPLDCWYEARCNMFHSTVQDLVLTEERYADLMGPQIAILNSLVLESVKRIVLDDPEAVLVLFSDHGARYSRPPNEEWNRNLFAARSAQHSLAPGVDGLFVRLAEAISPDR